MEKSVLLSVDSTVLLADDVAVDEREVEGEL